MKKLLKFTLVLLFLAMVYMAGSILLAELTYYSPNEHEVLSTATTKADILQIDSVYSAMIWNIGYGGLGKEMDFFYDKKKGGRVRPKKAWHKRYFSEITNYLIKNDDTDFMLLQEVDEKAKRSFKTNEKAILSTIKPHADFALNYHVNYVPAPLTKPHNAMGKVKSGLLSLSSYTPQKAVRHQLPGSYGWPDKLFLLRRCFVSQRFMIAGSEKEFLVINTHHSAYDDGSLKEQEMVFLRDFIISEYKNGNYVLVGGDWNQQPPQMNNAWSISTDYLPHWHWVFDKNVTTNRSLEKPFDGTNEQQIIDFFLVSPNIEIINFLGIDLGFEASDHHPVFLDFKLLNQ